MSWFGWLVKCQDII